MEKTQELGSSPKCFSRIVYDDGAAHGKDDEGMRQSKQLLLNAFIKKVELLIP